MQVGERSGGKQKQGDSGMKRKKATKADDDGQEGMHKRSKVLSFNVSVSLSLWKSW